MLQISVNRLAIALSDTFIGILQDVYNNAESILSSALAEWEVILCTCNCLDQVWAQVLPDPFLRRLILRYLLSSTGRCTV